MPKITGNVKDAGLAVPANARVVFRLPDIAFDVDGGLHVTEDLEASVDAGGSFSATLPQLLPGTPMFVGVAWWERESDLRMGRAARIDWLPRPVAVPEVDAALLDLVGIDPATGLLWQGSTPPPSSMLWQFLDPSYDPATATTLPVYTLPDGTTITHGEIVEWSA